MLMPGNKAIDEKIWPEDVKVLTMQWEVHTCTFDILCNILRRRIYGKRGSRKYNRK